MFERSTIYYAPDDESGAAPVGEQEPIVAPVVEAPPAGEAEPIVEEGAEPIVEEAAPPPTDWGARVEEWGGETTVAEAVQLRQALATRDGVEELFRQAGRALGFGDPAISALFDPNIDPDAEPEPTVEDLLSDPERVLTAGDIQRILSHEREQAQAQSDQQRTAQTILSAIESSFEDLKIADEDDRIAVLTLADQLVPKHQQGDPAVVSQAIRTAHERFQSKVRAAAEAIVQNRAAVHEALPTPLPAGGGSGGSAIEEEPKTLAEAKERARKQLGIS